MAISSTMTMQGAEKLARNIKSFWGCQGYEVKTWVQSIRDLNDKRGGTYVYEVKTDLINGLPRNYKGKINGKS